MEFPSFPASAGMTAWKEKCHEIAVSCLTVLASLALATASFAADETPVTLTIYNDNFAMVQEVRGLRLARGTQEYRVSDVTDQIEPTSVRFLSLTEPDTVTLHEQRFEFDLAGTDRLLERYLGRPVVVTIEEGGTFSGTLLNAHSGDAILQLEDGSVQVIKGQTITTLQFPALPEGLITKPTLVWLLESTKSMKHNVQISYLTKGIQWQAEYIASIRRKRRASSSLAGGPPSKTVRATPSRTPGSGSWPATCTGSLRKPIEPKTACEGKRP